MQSCSSRLVLLLLKLKARGAGKASPESTSCQLGSTVLRSSRPRTTRCEPAKPGDPQFVSRSHLFDCSSARGAAARYQKENGPSINHTLCTWLQRSSTGIMGDAAGSAVQVAFREAGSRLSAGVLELELIRVQDWLCRTALPSASEMA